MFRYLIFSLLLFCFSATAFSKSLDSLLVELHKEYAVDWDNDMFVYTDIYYTQGAQMTLVHPSFRKNPINHLFFTLPNASNYAALGGIHEIFTPKDVRDTLANFVDRPYAGTFFIRSSISSAQLEHRHRLTSQLDLGVLGPLAGAAQAQQTIHGWLGLGWPKGWQFQIKNRPIINYNLSYEKWLNVLPGVVDVQAKVRARVGTVHDDIQISSHLRLGLLNDPLKGYQLSNKAYQQNRNFELYLFGTAKVLATAYNATLMGGIIETGDAHTFKYSQICPIVTELTAGIRANYQSVGSQFLLTWQSPEFNTGQPHAWGTMSLYFRF